MTNTHSQPMPSTTKISPQLVPSSNVGRPEFSTMLQGPSTNALSRTSTQKNKHVIDNLENKVIIKDGNFTFTLSNYKELSGVRTSTHMLLDALIITLTETGTKSREIKLPLNEYMHKRGLRDRKETRRQVENDLQTLFETTMTFTQVEKNKDKSYEDVRIIYKKGIVNNVITVSLSEDFFNIITGYYPMSYPNELLKINSNKNPHSYYLFKKISTHKNMNLGNKNENLIGVKTLIAGCPELPSYEDLKNSNRAFSSRIKEPFERDMDYLSNSFSWEYCKKNGTPLDEEELAVLTYDAFERLLVNISWKSYPDKTEFIDKKRKEAEKAQAAKAKKKIKNKTE